MEDNILQGIAGGDGVSMNAYVVDIPMLTQFSFLARSSRLVADLDARCWMSA